MTTQCLYNKNPRKTAFWTTFLSAANPLPYNRKFYFCRRLAVSDLHTCHATRVASRLTFLRILGFSGVGAVSRYTPALDGQNRQSPIASDFGSRTQIAALFAILLYRSV